MKTLLLIALAFVIGCSEPTEPQTVNLLTGTWTSDATDGQIRWEMRGGTMWLCAPHGTPAPYALVTVVAGDATSYSIDAYHVIAPGLIYSFTLTQSGATYSGQLYSKTNKFPAQTMVFRQKVLTRRPERIILRA